MVKKPARIIHPFISLKISMLHPLYEWCLIYWFRMIDSVLSICAWVCDGSFLTKVIPTCKIKIARNHAHAYTDSFKCSILCDHVFQQFENMLNRIIWIPQVLNLMSSCFLTIWIFVKSYYLDSSTKSSSCIKEALFCKC